MPHFGDILNSEYSLCLITGADYVLVHGAFEERAETAADFLAESFAAFQVLAAERELESAWVQRVVPVVVAWEEFVLEEFVAARSSEDYLF